MKSLSKLLYAQYSQAREKIRVTYESFRNQWKERGAFAAYLPPVIAWLKKKAVALAFRLLLGLLREFYSRQFNLNLLRYVFSGSLKRYSLKLSEAFLALRWKNQSVADKPHGPHFFKPRPSIGSEELFVHWDYASYLGDTTRDLAPQVPWWFESGSHFSTQDYAALVSRRGVTPREGFSRAYESAGKINGLLDFTDLGLRAIYKADTISQLGGSPYERFAEAAIYKFSSAFRFHDIVTFLFGRKPRESRGFRDNFFVSTDLLGPFSSKLDSQSNFSGFAYLNLKNFYRDAAEFSDHELLHYFLETTGLAKRYHLSLNRLSLGRSGFYTAASEFGLEHRAFARGYFLRHLEPRRENQGLGDQVTQQFLYGGPPLSAQFSMKRLDKQNYKGLFADYGETGVLYNLQPGTGTRFYLPSLARAVPGDFIHDILWPRVLPTIFYSYTPGGELQFFDLWQRPIAYNFGGGLAASLEDPFLETYRRRRIRKRRALGHDEAIYGAFFGGYAIEENSSVRPSANRFYKSALTHWASHNDYGQKGFDGSLMLEHFNGLQPLKAAATRWLRPFLGSWAETRKYLFRSRILAKLALEERFKVFHRLAHNSRDFHRYRADVREELFDNFPTAMPPLYHWQNYRRGQSYNKTFALIGYLIDQVFDSGKPEATVFRTIADLLDHRILEEWGLDTDYPVWISYYTLLQEGAAHPFTVWLDYRKSDLASHLIGADRLPENTFELASLRLAEQANRLDFLKNTVEYGMQPRGAGDTFHGMYDPELSQRRLNWERFRDEYVLRFSLFPVRRFLGRFLGALVNIALLIFYRYLYKFIVVDLQGFILEAYVLYLDTRIRTFFYGSSPRVTRFSLFVPAALAGLVAVFLVGIWAFYPVAEFLTAAGLLYFGATWVFLFAVCVAIFLQLFVSSELRIKDHTFYFVAQVFTILTLVYIFAVPYHSTSVFGVKPNRGSYGQGSPYYNPRPFFEPIYSRIFILAQHLNFLNFIKFDAWSTFRPNVPRPRPEHFFKRFVFNTPEEQSRDYFFRNFRENLFKFSANSRLAGFKDLYGGFAARASESGVGSFRKAAAPLRTLGGRLHAGLARGPLRGSYRTLFRTTDRLYTETGQAIQKLREFYFTSFRLRRVPKKMSAGYQQMLLRYFLHRPRDVHFKTAGLAATEAPPPSSWLTLADFLEVWKYNHGNSTWWYPEDKGPQTPLGGLVRRNLDVYRINAKYFFRPRPEGVDPVYWLVTTVLDLIERLPDMDSEKPESWYKVKEWFIHDLAERVDNWAITLTRSGPRMEEDFGPSEWYLILSDTIRGFEKRARERAQKSAQLARLRAEERSVPVPEVSGALREVQNLWGFDRRAVSGLAPKYYAKKYVHIFIGKHHIPTVILDSTADKYNSYFLSSYLRIVTGALDPFLGKVSSAEKEASSFRLAPRFGELGAGNLVRRPAESSRSRYFLQETPTSRLENSNYTDKSLELFGYRRYNGLRSLGFHKLSQHWTRRNSGAAYWYSSPKTFTFLKGSNHRSFFKQFVKPRSGQGLTRRRNVYSRLNRKRSARDMVAKNERLNQMRKDARKAPRRRYKQYRRLLRQKRAEDQDRFPIEFYKQKYSLGGGGRTLRERVDHRRRDVLRRGVPQSIRDCRNRASSFISPDYWLGAHTRPHRLAVYFNPKYNPEWRTKYMERTFGFVKQRLRYAPSRAAYLARRMQLFGRDRVELSRYPKARLFKKGIPVRTKRYQNVFGIRVSPNRPDNVRFSEYSNFAFGTGGIFRAKHPHSEATFGSFRSNGKKKEDLSKVLFPESMAPAVLRRGTYRVVLNRMFRSNPTRLGHTELRRMTHKWPLNGFLANLGKKRAAHWPSGFYRRSRPHLVKYVTDRSQYFGGSEAAAELTTSRRIYKVLGHTRNPTRLSHYRHPRGLAKRLSGFDQQLQLRGPHRFRTVDYDIAAATSNPSLNVFVAGSNWRLFTNRLPVRGGRSGVKYDGFNPWRRSLWLNYYGDYESLDKFKKSRLRLDYPVIKRRRISPARPSRSRPYVEAFMANLASKREERKVHMLRKVVDSLTDEEAARYRLSKRMVEEQFRLHNSSRPSNWRAVKPEHGLLDDQKLNIRKEHSLARGFQEHRVVGGYFGEFRRYRALVPRKNKRKKLAINLEPIPEPFTKRGSFPYGIPSKDERRSFANIVANDKVPKLYPFDSPGKKPQAQLSVSPREFLRRSSHYLAIPARKTLRIRNNSFPFPPIEHFKKEARRNKIPDRLLPRDTYLEGFDFLADQPIPVLDKLRRASRGTIRLAGVSDKVITPNLYKSIRRIGYRMERPNSFLMTRQKFQDSPYFNLHRRLKVVATNDMHRVAKRYKRLFSKKRQHFDSRTVDSPKIFSGMRRVLGRIQGYKRLSRAFRVNKLRRRLNGRHLFVRRSKEHYMPFRRRYGFPVNDQARKSLVARTPANLPGRFLVQNLLHNPVYTVPLGAPRKFLRHTAMRKKIRGSRKIILKTAGDQDFSAYPAWSPAPIFRKLRKTRVQLSPAVRRRRQNNLRNYYDNFRVKKLLVRRQKIYRLGGNREPFRRKYAHEPYFYRRALPERDLYQKLERRKKKKRHIKARLAQAKAESRQRRKQRLESRRRSGRTKAEEPAADVEFLDSRPAQSYPLLRKPFKRVLRYNHKFDRFQSAAAKRLPTRHILKKKGYDVPRRERRGAELYEDRPHGRAGGLYRGAKLRDWAARVAAQAHRRPRRAKSRVAKRSKLFREPKYQQHLPVKQPTVVAVGNNQVTKDRKIPKSHSAYWTRHVVQPRHSREENFFAPFLKLPDFLPNGYRQYPYKKVNPWLETRLEKGLRRHAETYYKGPAAVIPKISSSRFTKLILKEPGPSKKGRRQPAEVFLGRNADYLSLDMKQRTRKRKELRELAYKNNGEVGLRYRRPSRRKLHQRLEARLAVSRGDFRALTYKEPRPMLRYEKNVDQPRRRNKNYIPYLQREKNQRLRINKTLKSLHDSFYPYSAKQPLTHHILGKGRKASYKRLFGGSNLSRRIKFLRAYRRKLRLRSLGGQDYYKGDRKARKFSEPSAGWFDSNDVMGSVRKRWSHLTPESLAFFLYLNLLNFSLYYGVKSYDSAMKSKKFWEIFGFPENRPPAQSLARKDVKLALQTPEFLYSDYDSYAPTYYKVRLNTQHSRSWRSGKRLRKNSMLARVYRTEVLPRQLRSERFLEKVKASRESPIKRSKRGQELSEMVLEWFLRKPHHRRNDRWSPGIFFFLRNREFKKDLTKPLFRKPQVLGPKAQAYADYYNVLAEARRTAIPAQAAVDSRVAGILQSPRPAAGLQPYFNPATDVLLHPTRETRFGLGKKLIDYKSLFRQSRTKQPLYGRLSDVAQPSLAHRRRHYLKMTINRSASALHRRRLGKNVFDNYLPYVVDGSTRISITTHNRTPFLSRYALNLWGGDEVAVYGNFNTFHVHFLTLKLIFDNIMFMIFLFKHSLFWLKLKNLWALLATSEAFFGVEPLEFIARWF